MGHIPRYTDKVSHTKATNRIAQSELCFDFVAFRNSYLAHVIAEAGDLESLRVVPGARRSRPDFNFTDNVGVLPITNNDLVFKPHPAHAEPELAVSMCRLVQVHEVHVDRGPREFPI